MLSSENPDVFRSNRAIALDVDRTLLFVSITYTYNHTSRRRYFSYLILQAQLKYKYRREVVLLPVLPSPWLFSIYSACSAGAKTEAQNKIWGLGVTQHNLTT